MPMHMPTLVLTIHSHKHFLTLQVLSSSKLPVSQDAMSDDGYRALYQLFNFNTVLLSPDPDLAT